jgi:hypothetical protein
LKKFRAKLNLSPLPSTSEEESEEEIPGPSLNDIPLPPPVEKPEPSPPEKKPKYGVNREWDEGKDGFGRWIEKLRDERHDDFRPPSSYHKK